MRYELGGERRVVAKSSVTQIGFSQTELRWQLVDLHETKLEVALVWDTEGIGDYKYTGQQKYFDVYVKNLRLVHMSSPLIFEIKRITFYPYLFFRFDMVEKI